MIAFTDIESSGLDENTGHLLEVAVVITDDNLEEKTAISVVTKPVGVDIEVVKEQCDPYVRDMHTRNGLFDAVRKEGMRRHEAEEFLTGFIESAFATQPPVLSGRCLNCKLNKKDHVGLVGAAQTLLCKDGSIFNEKTDPAVKHTPLGGSTVPFDRRWLKTHMSKLEGLFSHRHVDVSTVGELCKRWAPNLWELRPQSTETHRALADARGSIELLRYYKAVGFVSGKSMNGAVLEAALEQLKAFGLKVTR